MLGAHLADVWPSDGVVQVDDVLWPGRRVVAKAASEPRALEALAREVRATCAIAHPACRAVLAYWPGPPARALFEQVEGEPLAQWLAARAASATHVARQLLDVLRAFHSAGLVHGDLKPEHVLIDLQGELRLLDLGLSSALGAPARGGTHGFIAPELLAGEPSSVQSDLFAFGRTLELACPPHA